MRVPGAHVLLTAGVVAVTSIGTVAAFSLTGSSEADQRLPAVAPPPAVAAPLEPAPLPPAPPSPAPPAPVAEQETASAEPTRDAAPEPDRSRSDDRDQDRRAPERAPDPPKDKGDDKPGKSTVKPDKNGTDQEKLAYACQAGFLHGDICKRYT